MIPTILQIGPFPVHSFGLMMVLCFLGAWRLLAMRLEAAGKPIEIAEKLITWGALGGLLGARFGYLISFPSDLFSRPLATIFGSAGFVFQWGLIGGIFACWMVVRREKESFLTMADLVAPALSLGYAIGRIGCQFSGDGDYGGPSNLPWAMSYSTGVVPTPVGVLVHPAPVYETLVALAITAVLMRPALRARLPRAGQLFGMYLILSSLSRYFIEMVRIEPIVLPPFTQAQVVSLCLGVLGLIFLFQKRKPQSLA